eukprot:3831084-Ditylum_brightwellii.AAC.1
MQTCISLKHIPRKYDINSENTKPKHQHQNHTEHRIQDVKRTSAKILDCTETPGYTWFFCMMYTIVLLNFMAVESLGRITPHQA